MRILPPAISCRPSGRCPRPPGRRLLDEAGFTGITADVLPAITEGPRTAATLLVSARRPPCGPSTRTSETARTHPLDKILAPADALGGDVAEFCRGLGS